MGDADVIMGSFSNNAAYRVSLSDAVSSRESEAFTKTAEPFPSAVVEYKDGVSILRLARFLTADAAAGEVAVQDVSLIGSHFFNSLSQKPHHVVAL